MPISTWTYDTCPILPSAPDRCIIPKCTACLCLCYSIFLEMPSPSIFPVFKFISNTVTFCEAFSDHPAGCYCSVFEPLWYFVVLLWPVPHYSLDQSLVSLIASISQGGVLMDACPPLLKTFWRRAFPLDLDLPSSSPQRWSNSPSFLLGIFPSTQWRCLALLGRKGPDVVGEPVGKAWVYPFVQFWSSGLGGPLLPHT